MISYVMSEGITRMMVDDDNDNNETRRGFHDMGWAWMGGLGVLAAEAARQPIGLIGSRSRVTGHGSRGVPGSDEKSQEPRLLTGTS